MQQLIQQIEQWADDRNLIEGSNPQKQMLKLMEEFGELCGGIAKNNPEVIKDSIGDCFVVLTILSNQIFENFPICDAIQQGEQTYPLALKEEVAASFLMVTKTFGELANAIGTTNDLVKCFYDAIGFLTILAIALNLDIQDCVQHAYNQIKDRKGKMIDGVFVKEDDL